MNLNKKSSKAPSAKYNPITNGSTTESVSRQTRPHTLRKTDLFLTRPAIETVTVQGKGFLARADALIFARALRAEIADIVFLDPPFNLGKEYGVARWLEKGDPDAYEFYMKSLLGKFG